MGRSVELEYVNPPDDLVLPKALDDAHFIRRPRGPRVPKIFGSGIRNGKIFGQERMTSLLEEADDNVSKRIQNRRQIEIGNDDLFAQLSDGANPDLRLPLFKGMTKKDGAFYNAKNGKVWISRTDGKNWWRELQSRHSVDNILG